MPDGGLAFERPDPSSRFYIAGINGLVGSAIARHLKRSGFPLVFGHASSDLDLRRPQPTLAALRELRPDFLVMAAARVGGIGDNSRNPVAFLEDNLSIQLSVLGAARTLRVPRVLFLGSSCIYPREAPQPIPESALMTGPLEVTNESYAIAKIAGIRHVKAVREAEGLPWISLMPTNLYGPGDNFDLETSHVLPALLARTHRAAQTAAPFVDVWGSGRPLREFLHVDDLAEACMTALNLYDDDQHLNVGSSTEVSIRELVDEVTQAVGYMGEVRFDASKPDGTPRKLLDSTRIRALGWEPQIPLSVGIRKTYQWYVDNLG